MMSIHKEGYEIILIAIVVLTIVNVLFYYFVPVSRTVHVIIAVASIILLIMILQFFRSPNRDVTLNENNIIAPADGRIVAIKEVEETEYFNEKMKKVSIFMSPLNVHINWYPVSGNIKYFKYHPGDYLVAWHPKSSTKNERTTVVIENDKASIIVRQIAGTVARRIVYYCKEGDTVTQGDELGFIKFGSRVDLFLPLNIKINVELNQKVTGRETVIARFE